MDSKRADLLLAEMQQCSRSFAQQLIKDGLMLYKGKVVTKAGEAITDIGAVQVLPYEKAYVSRGGYKLKAAVDAFGLDLTGKVCIDVGASTGGFSDCMLQHGAGLVYAIENGTAQIHETLKAHPRLHVYEQTDIRNADLDVAFDFGAVDVSFISLKIVLPHLKRLLKPNAEAVALIKPQFEAGREVMSKAGKHGIIKDQRVHKAVCDEITVFATDLGFEAAGLIPSPITGGDGNTEFLIFLRGLG